MWSECLKFVTPAVNIIVNFKNLLGQTVLHMVHLKLANQELLLYFQDESPRSKIGVSSFQKC